MVVVVVVVVVVASWQGVVLGYMTYLAVASLTRRDFARARPTLGFAAAAAWGAYAAFRRTPLSPALEVAIPAAILLGGYWLSGLLFVRPDTRIERWLESVDRAALTGILGWYRRAPRPVSDYLELSYLLVYAAVPAGAATLALGGHADQIGRFWTVVLLAEFTCYGMLPWIPTRSPRALEPWWPPRGPLRGLNQQILDRASIRANTVPSGHAAGALATALAVGSTMPVAGAVFLLVAASIAAATVLGRYHYLADTVLGLLVAVAAWRLL